MTTSLPVRLDDLIDHITHHHPDGDVLAQLSDAYRLAAALDEQADHLISHFVDRARRSGASWSAIGEHMGVSKQAAQKRFVTGDRDDRSLNDILADGARFTGRTKVVLGKSEIVARNLRHPQILPVHMVHALSEEPYCLAIQALTQLGADAERVHQAVSPAIPPKGDGPGHTGDIPLSAASREVLKLTLREALGLGHNYIGTEHLLLGVLATGGEAAEALGGLGVTHASAKEKVLAILADMAATSSGR